LKTEMGQGCPECGSRSLFIDHKMGELVCEVCGVVASSSLVDQGPEWRAFDQGERERRARTGAPITLSIHDGGLSTVIDWRGRDAYGVSLSPEQRVRMNRLRKWNRRSTISNSKERSLAYALSELNKASYGLNLPRNVLETASAIYRRAIRERVTKGRSIQGVAAASLYMACRQCGVIRTLDEVSDATGITRKELGKSYRHVRRTLEADVPRFNRYRYISVLVNHLALSGEVEAIAKEILEWAARLRLTGGRGPAGMAAASTYIACRLKGDLKTQSDFAKVVGVTEVTLRNRYKELVKNLEIEMEL
jgi:transcription initiation factor TFIIB